MRVYSQDIKSACLEKINTVSSSIDTNEYALNDLPDAGACSNEYDLSKTATASAIKNMDELKDKLSILSARLGELYDQADMTFADIVKSADDICRRIKVVSETVNELIGITGSVGSLSGTALNIDSLKIAQDKVKPYTLSALRNNLADNDSESWQKFIDFLKRETGDDSIDRNKADAFKIFYDVLKRKGFCDEAVLEFASDIVSYSSFSSINGIPGSEQDKMVTEWIKNGFKNYATRIISRRSVEHVKPDYTDDYLNILNKNLSDKDKVLFISSLVDPDSTFLNMESDKQFRFMLDLAMAGEGYEGKEGEYKDGHNVPNSFFGAYHNKNSVDWCALYVVWVLSWSGYLGKEKTLVKGFSYETAIDEDHSWSSCEEIKKSFDKEYGIGIYVDFTADRTCWTDIRVGDIIICHGGAHVAIVTKVDEENQKIYTIEGNNSNSISYGFIDMNQDTKRKCPNMIGYIPMGCSDEQDIGIMDNKKIDRVVTYNWNQKCVDYWNKNDEPSDQYYLDHINEPG